jgi:hypothetical protein
MEKQKSVADAARPIFESLKSQLEADHRNRFVAIEPCSTEHVPDRTCRRRSLRDANTMKGVVDDSGSAILPIKIPCPKYPIGVRVDAWIDTGFTGDLVLPQSFD